jgi:hypothetical protein
MSDAKKTSREKFYFNSSVFNAGNHGADFGNQTCLDSNLMVWNEARGSLLWSAIIAMADIPARLSSGIKQAPTIEASISPETARPKIRRATTREEPPGQAISFMECSSRGLGHSYGLGSSVASVRDKDCRAKARCPIAIIDNVSVSLLALQLATPVAGIQSGGHFGINQPRSAAAPCIANTVRRRCGPVSTAQYRSLAESVPVIRRHTYVGTVTSNRPTIDRAMPTAIVEQLTKAMVR